MTTAPATITGAAATANNTIAGRTTNAAIPGTARRSRGSSMTAAPPVRSATSQSISPAVCPGSRGGVGGTVCMVGPLRGRWDGVGRGVEASGASVRAQQRAGDQGAGREDGRRPPKGGRVTLDGCLPQHLGRRAVVGDEPGRRRDREGAQQRGPD